jgi:hypothetical protein
LGDEPTWRLRHPKRASEKNDWENDLSSQRKSPSKVTVLCPETSKAGPRGQIVSYSEKKTVLSDKESPGVWWREFRLVHRHNHQQHPHAKPVDESAPTMQKAAAI